MGGDGDGSAQDDGEMGLERTMERRVCAWVTAEPGIENMREWWVGWPERMKEKEG